METGKITQKINYDALTESALAAAGSVLLHCCCAPCATSVTERVIKTIKPVLYYYNPNIYPEAEYLKRLSELEKLARHFSLELISEPYDENEFLDAIAGFENEKEGGARCPVCFRVRLEKTAARAKREGLAAFCTTLTVSPHKNAAIVNAIGEEVAAARNILWIPSDFKKRNGYLRSCQMCRELDIYRQNYCGCRFSIAREENE